MDPLEARYQEFKLRWGNTPRATLIGLNAGQQFNTHQREYRRLLSELEDESAEALANEARDNLTKSHRITIIGIIAASIIGVAAVVVAYLKP